MATNLSAFLGNWAKTVNRKITGSDERIDALLATPRNYRVPPADGQSFHDGNFTVTCPIVQESYNYYLYVKSSTADGTEVFSYKYITADQRAVTKVYKVTESVGFIVYSLNVDFTYTRRIAVLGFNISDTGNITLGDNTANIIDTGYGSWYDETAMVFRNLYDDLTFVIFHETYNPQKINGSAMRYTNGVVNFGYLYTVLKFSANSAQFSRLTDEYSCICVKFYYPDYKGRDVTTDSVYKTTFSSCKYELDGSDVVVSVKDSSNTPAFPYNMQRYNSSYTVTKTWKEATFLPAYDGGLPIFDVTNGFLTDDGSKVLGIYLTHDKSACYAITFLPGRYTYRYNWWDTSDCFAVWLVNFSAKTFTKTNLTLSDIVDSIL